MEAFDPSVVGAPQVGIKPVARMPICKFSVVFESNAAESEKAGRKVGKTKEIVLVKFPGGDEIPWDISEQLWPKVRAKCGVDIEPLYREWKRQRSDDPVNGTALQWVSPLSGSQVSGLNALGIRTLEELIKIEPQELICLGPEGRRRHGWRGAGRKQTTKTQIRRLLFGRLKSCRRRRST
jgi:hypothetical protein